MSHTYSIDHALTSTESVNVEVAPKSEMSEVATDVDTKTGDIVSQYRIASGDALYPAFVTYRVQNQTRRGTLQRRMVVTFDTWATDDDGAGLVVKRPVSASISFIVPGDLTVELADVNNLVGNLFSFLYPSVSAGTRSTAHLQKLLYGVPRVV